MERSRLVYQFKVTLLGIKPPIWRRIQVPGDYTFWDLHVAIQDAMGWLDYHFHTFLIAEKGRSKPIEIGIPRDEMEEGGFLSGWEVPIREFFKIPGEGALYEYDFGDMWEHEVLLEGIFLREKKVRYPRCIGGERACPPEDCGGIWGYQTLIKVIGNPKHKEYRDYVGWLKGHAKNYYPYDPEKFEAEKVHFDNPKKRWNRAFGS